jgi:hypothetical protein
LLILKFALKILFVLSFVKEIKTFIKKKFPFFYEKKMQENLDWQRLKILTEEHGIGYKYVLQENGAKNILFTKFRIKNKVEKIEFDDTTKCWWFLIVQDSPITVLKTKKGSKPEKIASRNCWRGTTPEIELDPNGIDMSNWDQLDYLRMQY